MQITCQLKECKGFTHRWWAGSELVQLRVCSSNRTYPILMVSLISCHCNNSLLCRLHVICACFCLKGFFFIERFFLFAHLHIYFTKLHYHTIYITILKLHTTYILAVLVVYNLYTLFILPTLQETNKQNKTNTKINMYH